MGKKKERKRKKQPYVFVSKKTTKFEMWELRERKITQANIIHTNTHKNRHLQDNLHDAQFITHFTIENVYYDQVQLFMVAIPMWYKSIRYEFYYALEF